MGDVIDMDAEREKKAAAGGEAAVKSTGKAKGTKKKKKKKSGESPPAEGSASSGDLPMGPDGEAQPAEGEQPEIPIDVAPGYTADVNEAIDHAAQNAGPLTIEEAVKLERKVIHAWDKWNSETKKLGQVNKETSQAEQAAEGNFRAEIEKEIKGKTVSDADRARVRKLKNVESAWASWQEVKARGIEQRKEARHAVQAAAKRLREVVENARQLVLPGVEDDDGNPIDAAGEDA